MIKTTTTNIIAGCFGGFLWFFLIVFVSVLFEIVRLTSVGITTRPDSIEAGILTSLQCATNPAFPIATVSWNLNNRMITTGIASTTELSADGGIITASNMNRTYTDADNGHTLVCSATNGEATLSSAVFILNITGKLRFSIINCANQFDRCIIIFPLRHSVLIIPACLTVYW